MHSPFIKLQAYTYLRFLATTSFMLQNQQKKIVNLTLYYWHLRLGLLSLQILFFSIVIQPAVSLNSVDTTKGQSISSPDQPQRFQGRSQQDNVQIKLEKERLWIEREKLRIEEQRLQLEQKQNKHRSYWGIAGELGTWTTIIGTVATIVGGTVVFFNYRVAVKNLKVSEDRQITERFTAAINQLGTKAKEGEGNKISIRLGGIYALERIAKDSETDHWTIMEVLSEFIRVESPSSAPKKIMNIDQNNLFPGITKDVQAALTVIGRRKDRQESEILNLSKVNLRDANLVKARLSGANFTSSQLSRANLMEADLRGANFHWASLKEADLRGTDLTGANLKGANLRGAKRDSHTKFDQPWDFVYQLVNVVEDGIVEKRWEEKIHEDFENKDLSGANLSEIYLHENILENANFSEANFSGATLEFISIDKTNFNGSNFTGAEINGISEQMEFGANFTEANFTEANLNGVCFGKSDLSNANFFNATILGGDFSKATLDKTNFSGADLSQANLYGVNFNNVIIDNNTKLDKQGKWRRVIQFQRSGNACNNQVNVEDLIGIDLSGAYLRRVSFENADLRKADLSDTDLYKANLSGANLSGANLSGANLLKAILDRVDFKGTIVDEKTKLSSKWELVYKLVNKEEGNNDLKGKDLSNANLIGVDLKYSNLKGVDLRGAILDENTQLNDKWKLVYKLVNQLHSSKDLSGADLSGAFLPRIDFSDFDLKNTNISDTDFRWASFWSRDLKDDELSKAKKNAKQVIQSAKNWRLAKYSQKIRVLLELPSKK